MRYTKFVLIYTEILINKKKCMILYFNPLKQLCKDCIVPLVKVKQIKYASIDI